MPSFHKGDLVVLKRSIERVEGCYASTGPAGAGDATVFVHRKA